MNRDSIHDPGASWEAIKAARAREEIIKPWANDYYIANQIVDRDASREWAEARYAREISHAHKGEEG